MLQTTHNTTVHSRQSPAPPGAGEATPSWELVAAAQGGDRGAFGPLYGRYVGPVSSFLSSRVPDRALAEDLTSETFLRALRRIDSVSDQGQGRDVGAWFTTIARNLLLDHVKSSRARWERPTAEISDAAVGQDGPEQTAIRADTAATVHHGVGQLPADQQRCIRLRFLQERSVAETAAVMGRSGGAIAGLTHRALQNLRSTVGSDGAGGAVPRTRAATAPDPLAQARHAVAGAQRRAGQTGTEHQAEEAARAQRVAHWAAADQAAEREHTRGGLAAVAEGVA